ncbi:Fur family zinc uptake transcriptional regulator [Geothermobacter ehrlichii]|uniref:Fur family zinc uptake transcriptional regulator n=1 Tax=Geothermobacter ehrlichii TaxID=213224 RepID=A0A5D3WL61_9BACT|nr:Fur family transcriptional regulator [Geothermobacter ehrlichii]TYO99181.1 Fur family zinc uptake transcriptional regulator [Geothermobacter ehrlichii]
MPAGCRSIPFSPDHDHGDCVRQALDRAEQVCRARGARLTPLRRRVLELLWQSHRPVGAYDLLARLQREGRAAPPTVYRTLDFLLRLGLVHRIASLNAWIGCCRPDEPHSGQFLICRSCNALDELNVSQVDDSIRNASQRAGFIVEEQTVEIFGLCHHCREANHD